MYTKYANPEHTQVTIKYDDGRVTTGNKEQLIRREYIDVDTVIEPYETAQEKADREYEEARLASKQARDEALNEITHTFSDGSVVQTRPGDLRQFQTAIGLNESHRWIMADNTVRLLTVSELEEAMNSGIAQAQVIWEDYADAIEAL